jgi:TetR/AcrR family fatty acid metabolism transcriptional regulator
MMAHSANREHPGSAPPTPSTAPEKTAPGADPEKRRRILEAAIRTFGRRGFHEARIADIAADAKVAEGTVYLYFRNKEDLLGVVFDTSMDDVLEKGRAVARSGAPAAERLTALVDLHLQFIGSDRDLASVFQIELRRSARLVERFSRSKLVEHFRLLGDVLKDGIETGEFARDLDPRLAVRILFGAADEILSEWLLSGERKPTADARQLVGTLLHGFAAPETREKEKEKERKKEISSKGKKPGVAVARRTEAHHRATSNVSSKGREPVGPPSTRREALQPHSPFEARAGGANGGTKNDMPASGHRSNPK